MTRLSAIHLEKSYKSRQVVKDFSIDVCEGEVVGLLGPNGAGKTTSFYMIVGLIAPDNGQVKLGDNDISHFAMHQRARLGIGYLPQEPSIFRKLTVSQNILAILELNPRLKTKTDRQKQLDSLLQELHISHIKDSLGISLSGGERRRVEIARALAIEPKFILLDEPFAGIDPISVIDIKRIISHLKNRGIGVLITDHNVRETLDICARAYIVSEGCIIAAGEPKEILANQTVREVYLGDEFNL
jgi:lipopolysaccharide export system ATP-binding protein